MDNLTQKQRRYCMSKIRSKDTKPKKNVRIILDKLNARYNIHAKALPGTPDIVIPETKNIIFVNGYFWHQHKNCKKANRPVRRKKISEAAKDIGVTPTSVRRWWITQYGEYGKDASLLRHLIFQTPLFINK